MIGNLFTTLAVLAVLFFWSRAALQFRARLIAFREMLLWSTVWIAALLVLIRPAITGVIATKLGIGRGSDVVVYVSIILLFYLMFRIYIKMDSMEREITSLVRALAIEQSEGKQKSK